MPDRETRVMNVKTKLLLNFVLASVAVLVAGIVRRQMI